MNTKTAHTALLALTASLASTAALATELQSLNAPGPKEKQAVEQVRQNKLPELHKKLNEALGFEVELDIRWQTFAVKGFHGNFYTKGFEEIIFGTLTDVFEEFTQDTWQKEAAQKGIKRIVLLNTVGEKLGRDGWARRFYLKDGVLTFDHSAVSYTPKARRDAALRHVLENALRKVASPQLSRK